MADRSVTAYYNEIDPFAAAWLGRLIAGGHIAPGVVDTRSIEDVTPSDLKGFTQCHFFAGIGVWSYALRRAGWSDDRPVWTGSCPCQPFSAAGKGGGFTDERHLWPAWFHLIESCGPAVVIGEQVASKDGLAWLDLVRADMEGTGRAFGAADLCAAGLGAPHIRQRSWWVGLAEADASGLGKQRGVRLQRSELYDVDGRRASVGLADADDAGLERRGGMPERAGKRVTGTDGLAVGLADLSGGGHTDSRGDAPGGLADANGRDARAEREQRGGKQRLVAGDRGAGIGLADAQHDDGRADEPRGRSNRRTANGGGGEPVRLADASEQYAGTERRDDRGAGSAPAREIQQNDVADVFERYSDTARDEPATGPTNGFWANADWLYCRDGKWRPVEPGTLPLVNGTPNRVGRLRGYGNAIAAPVAQAFIETIMSCL